MSNINLAGILAFVAALGAGLIARLFVPDEIMTAPSPALSTAESVIATVYVFVFVGWLAIYFRTPRSALLAALGTVWSAIGTAFLVAVVPAEGWKLLPALAILATFCLLTLVHSVWLKRTRAPASTPRTPPP
jgi:hypothetical protein